MPNPYLGLALSATVGILITAVFTVTGKLRGKTLVAFGIWPTFAAWGYTVWAGTRFGVRLEPALVFASIIAILVLVIWTLLFRRS